MDVAGVSIDLAAVTTAQKVVLVEGGSDKAAVEVLAGRRGQVLGGAGIHVVAMGGATSIGHFLALLGPYGISARTERRRCAPRSLVTANTVSDKYSSSGPH